MRDKPLAGVLDLGPPTGDETILHVDMDAFYASVEQRDSPSLRGRPVIVGGQGNRGVVAAASYEARRYGVHSAMPTARARRLCPDGIFLSPNFEKYQGASEHIREIFESFTPQVEPLSLDEAFLDVTGARRIFGGPPEIGAEIRRRITRECHLTASVGCAANKLVAKLASRAAKPDGLVYVPAGRETAFLHPLPVSELWGVGEVTFEQLDRLGIRTVGELCGIPVRTLERILGAKHGRHLHALAHSRDDSPVVVHRAPKSIGHEETFEVDLCDPDSVRTELLHLSDRVALRVRRAGVSARTITVKCRLASFRTLSRSRTLAEAIDTGPEIYEVACGCLTRLQLGHAAIRLLGVAASGLIPGPAVHQLAFGPVPRWQALMAATDAVRARYGDDSVQPARLLGRLELSGPGESPQLR